MQNLKKFEKVLGDRIKEKLLSIIYNGSIKYFEYFVLWKSNVLKYLENEEENYLKYLVYK